MHAFLTPGRGLTLLLILEYSGINKEQRIHNRSNTAHRKPPIKCFLTPSPVKMPGISPRATHCNPASSTLHFRSLSGGRVSQVFILSKTVNLMEAWLFLGRCFSKDAWVLSHFSHVWLPATPWTVARQAPLSMGFSGQEYWGGLPSSRPRDRTQISCTVGGFLTTEPPGMGPALVF